MRKLLKKFSRSVVRRFGYDLTPYPKPPLWYELELEAMAAIRKIRSNSMVANECLVSLWQQVRHCETEGLPGCYVECGVWKGGSVGLIALANLAFGAERRHIHLFDSFDDICEPDPTVDGERAVSEAERWAGADKTKLAGRLEPLSGFYDGHGGPGNLEEVKHLLENQINYDPDFLHYQKGWFQDTLPKCAESIGPIALLRLDADWYASTKFCLDSLYDEVVEGGFIIFDDYGAYEGCQKAVDDFVRENNLGSFLHHVNAECRYIVK